MNDDKVAGALIGEFPDSLAAAYEADPVGALNAEFAGRWHVQPYDDPQPIPARREPAGGILICRRHVTAVIGRNPRDLPGYLVAHAEPQRLQHVIAESGRMRVALLDRS